MRGTLGTEAVVVAGRSRPFDLTLANRPFLFDDDPVFSDFALFGVLGNLTYHQYNSLPASQRNLADWFEKMKAFQYGPEAGN